MPHVEWLEPSAALARLVTYQQGARAFHAVVVKLAVSLEHASTAKLIAPADWVAVERHLDKDIARSIAQPSDLAPRKEQVDLVLTGHAYAPGGRPVEAHAVRFAVFGPKGALFDRTLHVLGDRKPG